MKELWIRNSVFIYIFFHKNGIFQKGQKKGVSNDERFLKQFPPIFFYKFYITYMFVAQ